MGRAGQAGARPAADRDKANIPPRTVKVRRRITFVTCLISQPMAPTVGSGAAFGESPARNASRPAACLGDLGRHQGREFLRSRSGEMIPIREVVDGRVDKDITQRHGLALEDVVQTREEQPTRLRQIRRPRLGLGALRPQGGKVDDLPNPDGLDVALAIDGETRRRAQ